MLPSNEHKTAKVGKKLGLITGGNRFIRTYTVHPYYMLDTQLDAGDTRENRDINFLPNGSKIRNKEANKIIANN